LRDSKVCCLLEGAAGGGEPHLRILTGVRIAIDGDAPVLANPLSGVEMRLEVEQIGRAKALRNSMRARLGDAARCIGPPS
jgi:hypothetical protein